MNYKFLLFFFLIFQISCVNQSANKTIKPVVNKHYFLNKGFTLVYTDDLYKEKLIDSKIENRSLKIFQKNLKKNSTVKITNLINSKYLIAKVAKKAEYPYFYNSVISQRIVEELEIDELEPYIEIQEIIEESSFVAKKAKTYDEEKNVATKAPIDDIQIKNLSKNDKKKTKISKRKFKYIILVADFYFKNSANQMKSRIIKETSIKQVNINKLSSTKFRVFLGPFNDLNSSIKLDLSIEQLF